MISSKLKIQNSVLFIYSYLNTAILITVFSNHISPLENKTFF